MTTATAQLLLIVALAALLVTAMVTDWRNRDIPNWLTAAVALLAPLWWWASGLVFWPEIGMHLIVFAAVLAAGIGLFALGAMGGGDVKLLAALALWLPGLEYMQMAIIMSLLGGFLTTSFIAAYHVRRPDAGQRMPQALIASFVFWALAVSALFVRGIDQYRGPLILLLVAGALWCALRVGRRIPAEKRPETPYGLAISAAALLMITQRNLNQFV